MLYVFHGDDQFKSRIALNQLLDQNTDKLILRLDAKEIEIEKVNNFLNNALLFPTGKILVLTNPFSVNKSILDKLQKIILDTKEADIAIWQDKNLLQTQLKSLKNAKVSHFPADNQLFTCLFAVKPDNQKIFIPLFHKILKKDLYDLFLYLLKNNLRKQLSSYSRFDKNLLRSTCLKLIELDFQNKSGLLSTSKELILEKILVDLIEK